MKKKRWLALLGAGILFVVSIISQLSADVATTDWHELLDFDEVTEKEIEPGFGEEKIVVVSLEGVIEDVEEDPLVRSGLNDYKKFLNALDQAAKDESVSGVIIDVNSPGGGVVESAEIHDKVVEIQEDYQKPVYISMGNTAASGGYYISAPAEKIVAHPATLTGSIGVIMESLNFADFAKELGIDFNTIKSGKHKDIMSGSRKMTDEEQDILQSMIDEMYDEFVQIIVDGRDIPEEKVRELGDGRVYTGKQAQEYGLVDELGSLEDTIALLEADNGWENSQVVEYEYGFNFDSFVGASVKNALGKDADLFQLQERLREDNAPRAMYLYSK